MENRTPLHRAVKYGNEKIVSLLLENDAEPNHPSASGKTPLHRATTPKNVQVLLSYGANPNIRDKKHNSAFYSLLRHNDEAAKVALDEFVRTNDKEMDSSDLLLVYDLDLFRHGKHEMSKHADMIDCNSELLFHPLSEAMTRLKWKCRSKMNYFFIVLKLVFTASLTWLVTKEFGLDSTTWKTNLGKNCTEFIFPKIEGEPKTTKNDVEPILVESLCSNLELQCVYCVALGSVLMLLLREIAQGLGNIVKHFKNSKNWLDLVMIISTITYLSVEFNQFFHVSLIQLPSREFAAVSIFLAWIDLVLLLGSIPSVGIYVYMFTNVSKTLMFFILIYSPALMAFALCFHVLLPKEIRAFQNPWKSSLKILAMMIGEFEYEGTFMTTDTDTDSTSNSTSIILAQVISVFFLCFASIVIMNLLVGLTVNEMDKLKSEAWQASVKSHVSKLIHFQKFWCKEKRKNRITLEKTNATEKQSLLCCFCDLWERFFSPTFSIFARLKDELKRNNGETYYGYSKVCVQPISTMDEAEKRNTWYRNCLTSVSSMLPVSLRNTSYTVYFYDEWRMEHGPDTGFKFPKELVDNTIKRLKSKESLKKELFASD